MRQQWSISCAALSLSIAYSCVPLESQATRSSPPQASIALPEGTTVATKGESAGVITGAIDPNATEPQLLKASADSNISKVVLAFPPGSLAIATDISLKEGSSIGSELLLKELGLSTLPTVTNSAVAVEVTSSAAIDLKVPMILALPLPAGFGLNTNPIERRRLGVLYRVQVQDTGQKLVGFVPASELTIDENGKVLYPSLYFGSFQVVVFDQLVAKVEIPDTQPTFEGIQYIIAGLALPSCGRADVGRVVYVEETKQFQSCGAGGWVVVDLKGPVGATGATGPTGATGATGPTGAAGAAATGTSANLPLAVFDGNGAPIGRFLGNNGLRDYYVTLTGGTTVRINSLGVVSSVAELMCQYPNTGCTGTCYLLTTYGSAIGDYIKVIGKDLGGSTVNFEYQKIASYNSNSTATQSYGYMSMSNYNCYDYPGTISGYYTAAAYTLPFTTVVPPMEVKTE